MSTPLSSGLLSGPEEIEPYSMHVSARYLELTKNKLALTRMPREIGKNDEERWKLGTPKSALEPLIDYWQVHRIESYDWRAQEAFFNSTLRQYRTAIRYPPLQAPPDINVDDIDIEAEAATPPSESELLRIHFVHHRASSATAIPLLYCHTWPGSFLEISRCLDALVNPVETPTQQTNSGVWREKVAFHVVAPSLPGYGFSDASSMSDFGLKETAGVMVELMRKLGYERFVVWGDSWGFKIARMIAIHHPSHVAAIYTSYIPDLPSPQPLKHKDAWLKYQVARLTGARFPWLSFGYTSSDFGAADMRIADDDDVLEMTELTTGDEDVEMGERVVVRPKLARDGSEKSTKMLPRWVQPELPTSTISSRPQTLAYGLCDSPSGLLALILDALKPSITYTAPAAALRSPMTRHRSLTVIQHALPTIDEKIPPAVAFTPADILNWTMMYWLPGPEASLRWLRNAEKEDCYAEYSDVPLGVTWYTQPATSNESSTSAQSVEGGQSTRSLRRSSSRSPVRGDENAQPSTTPPVSTESSPMWASAMHNLKWVKRRRDTVNSSVNAWEKSLDVIQDVRGFFEAGRNEGWLGL